MMPIRDIIYSRAFAIKTAIYNIISVGIRRYITSVAERIINHSGHNCGDVRNFYFYCAAIG